MEKVSIWYVMNYGLYYKEVSFNRQSMQVVNTALTGNFFKWEDGRLYDQKNETKRKSKIAWVKDEQLYIMLLKMVRQVNRNAGWNFNITGVEPIQYGLYEPGGTYNWHVDQHPRPVRGNVRKISMSLFLNDDYEGGEFDLEIYSPGVEPRYKSFKTKPGTAVFFQGDQWHRVRPVTSGLRKSLVAWFYGPPYS
ncbi:2OG-Fe(II) oxygenase [Synechococcus phage ACG-2014a]|uniref:2OG-Fe(II) oxygenase n=1 Tax=Synechococcus phage ACG-2014a TaxID=1493507 RepID=A0A0E3EV69_9CAUD|nr:2OG-Fe(II) oxygenase [Synechococcus phage ACG-2014a]